VMYMPGSNVHLQAWNGLIDGWHWFLINILIFVCIKMNVHRIRYAIYGEFEVRLFSGTQI